MKVKLAYPKIPDSKDFLPKSCVAFEKYDGTNIHFVIELCGDKSNGLCDTAYFGTRRDRFPLNNGGLESFRKAHPGLEDVANWSLLDSFLTPIEHYLYRYIGTTDSVTIFTEFVGNNSFAGKHDSQDLKQFVIFDVMISNSFLFPNELINQFGQFNLAKQIYNGSFNGQFVEDVRNGKYGVNEGVVCKGVHQGRVYMCKVKTNAYMERLKTKFKDNWKDYWE